MGDREKEAMYESEKRSEQRQEQQRIAQQQHRDEVAKAARDAVRAGIDKSR